jgi:hypothetical protein
MNTEHAETIARDIKASQKLITDLDRKKTNLMLANGNLNGGAGQNGQQPVVIPMDQAHRIPACFIAEFYCGPRPPPAASPAPAPPRPPRPPRAGAAICGTGTFPSKANR